MKSIRIPTPVRAALEDGAALAISMSGGKDSLAMASALVEAVDREGWPGEIYISSETGGTGRRSWPSWSTSTGSAGMACGGSSPTSTRMYP